MSSRWTTTDIPDQTGRRAIITGANSGIGYPTALELARHGATVVIASRDRVKGEAAVARILSAVPAAQVEFSELDLASLASIRAFAERELARNTPLHLLIDNAGIAGQTRRRETKDGFELTFGTNVLGHFALNELLLPALERAAAASPSAPPPRIVIIASIAHRRGQLNFNDLQARTDYAHMRAYTQSKLADLMLSLELDRRLRARGSRVLSIAAHPGVAASNIIEAAGGNAPEKAVRKLLSRVFATFFNSGAEGALPTLYAATSPEAQSGSYYGPQQLRETRGGDVGPAEISSQALDEQAAARLWQTCEDLTAIRTV